jgi:protein-S-isoprenylcysteine O-methyltransferase Ste14
LFAWICLFVSAYLIIAAVYELRRFGKQGVQRDNEPLLRFEKTTNLVTSGIYKYIRHPMYSSLLFLAWGIFLKDISWLTTLLVIAATILLYLTAVRDEEESQQFFGYDYQEYKFHTRMFVPFLF